jgi:DNA modification methylase
MAKTNDPLFKSRKSKTKASTAIGNDASLPPDVIAFNKTIIDRVTMVALNTLKTHPRRTRTHDERQITTIMGSFNTFGFLNPIVIDETNAVLAGDARVEAARRLGVTSLPAVRVDHLSDDEKRAYKIADNRITELAGWDLGELSIELTDLVSIEFNMDAIGFDTPTIDLVIAGGKGKADDEADPADTLPEEQGGPPVSRLGDLWLLGPHKVICGSALDPQILQAIMGDTLARMVLEDAPFNVPISGFVGGLGKVKHREFAMASGEMTNAEFLEFLTIASTNAAKHLVDGGLFYGFMDWRGLATYIAALEASGLDQKNLCVWNKMSGGMGSLYRSAHELCLVFKKGTAPHVNNVELGKHGRYRTNVWDHPGMASFGRGRDEDLKLHPTVKPVNLLADAIMDVTHQNEIVLDTFLGSGSTLIAAHKCKRHCRGVEIDPIYVDTIIRRFEAYAGMQAVHAVTTKTFAEMATERAHEAAAAQQPDDTGPTQEQESIHA